MKLDQKALSTLFHEDDSSLVRDAITKLVRRRYPVSRKTRYHIKVYDVNFYLPRERITIDPATRHGKIGVDALFELLDKMYPKPSVDFSFDDAD